MLCIRDQNDSDSLFRFSIVKDLVESLPSELKSQSLNGPLPGRKKKTFDHACITPFMAPLILLFSFIISSDKVMLCEKSYIMVILLSPFKYGQTTLYGL